jgi:peptidyl-prolyl cis-trans isomerase C
MQRYSVFVLVVLIAVCGCSKKRDDAPSQARPDPASLDPNEILISVNDHALTRGEAMRQVQLRLGGPPPSDLPAERVEQVQRQVLSTVIDEFVKRELLLAEADRLKIEAPEEKVESTLAGIRRRSPKGNEPKGILTDGPAGNDSLRNEVITAVRIEKLLETVLPESAEPSPAEIESFRQEHQAKLVLPERVKASHILIKVANDASPEEKTAARERAETVRKQLLEGADFATLAKDVSACPSAQRGGDLGVFPRGKMAPAFEQAAFSQPEGEIGDIIETPFGFHIIRVEKKLEAGPADDEQVIALLKQRSRAQVLGDYVRGLQRKADIKHSASVRPPESPAPPDEDGE